MNKQLPTITLVDREGRLLGNEIFKNKIVVLDFWNTSCGACFQKFPLLQELSNNYIKSNVEIYAVNVPLKRDTANQSFQVLEEWNFTFKNLNANESITEAMNVEYFPTTFIVVNGIITFKGDLLHVNSQLEKLLNHKQL
jgi:thiol-disulfide isomerase/thioredoxin